MVSLERGIQGGQAVTTDKGRKYVIDKLTSARNISELAAAWASVGFSYQRDTQIFELKEALKKQMEAKK